MDAGLEPATVPYQETALQVYKTCPLTIQLIHRSTTNFQISYFFIILLVIIFAITSEITFVNKLNIQPITIPISKCFILKIYGECRLCSGVSCSTDRHPTIERIHL